MKLSNPQSKYFVRAAVLLIVLLSTWWFLLRRPTLIALYTGVGVVFSLIPNAAITLEPSGDWTFRAPVFDYSDDVLRRLNATRLQSLDFTVPADDVATFMLGLPIYLALALAIPGPRRPSRFAWGLALQWAVGVLSVTLFAEVTAHHSLAQARGDTNPFTMWLREVVHYLLTAAVPFAAPVISVVWLHAELRTALFSAPSAARPAVPVPVPTPAPKAHALSR